ncbi:MAG: DUF4129 domain-containing protein [Arthrobacter sp.]|uniref:DUF4129 domain-containing protein n=1 Tax=Arthrobacter sp. TaxID=1667 RepID=UPI003494AC8F
MSLPPPRAHSAPRRSPRDIPREADRAARGGPLRGTADAWGPFLCVLLAAAVLVGAAAAIGPLTHGSPPGLTLPAVDLPEEAEEPQPPAEDAGEKAAADAALTDVAGQLIAASLFAVALLIVTGIIRLLRGTDGHDAAAARPAASDDPADPDELRTDFSRALAAAAATLDPREPTSGGTAVVAAWRGLEVVAEAHGRGRRGAQTPTEYAAVLLAAFGPPREPLRRLLHLYQRVRYAADPGTARVGAAELAGARADFEALARHLGTSGTPPPRERATGVPNGFPRSGGGAA